MVLDINQKKLSPNDNYHIYKEGELKYTAYRHVFQLMPKIQFFEKGANFPKMKIHKRFHLFKAIYDIIYADKQVFTFRTVSYLKSHYQYQNGNDTYDVYGHLGRKYSIYKNNKQTAWWKKDIITWLEGDRYRIIADSNSDAELLIAFCLIIDNYTSANHGDSILTINWGYFGSQAKTFDPDWIPY